MTLENQDLIATNPAFRKRVHSAAIAAALNIIGETADTPHRDERHALGMQVLNPDIMKRQLETFARVVAANPTIATKTPETVTDSEIEFTIATVWNDIAGVKAPAA